MVNPVENSDGANRQWVLGLEGRILIGGNIRSGSLKDNFGNDLKLGPVKIKKISIKGNQAEVHSFIQFIPTSGTTTRLYLGLKVGIT